MRKVFKDVQLEAQFQKDGYVIIPFLSNEEVADLWNQYNTSLVQSGGLITADDAQLNQLITYDFTFIDKNIEYKKLVFEIITNRFEKHVQSYLDNYSPIIANFIRKKSNNGEVPLHQNWAFVNERKCTSISIWCPLVDSNESNGTLQVVPSSHKRFGEFRGPMVPWELDNIKHEIIEKYLVPMNVKAGQAVVLDDSLVHYSAINKTNNLRLAIQLILIPAEEKSIHYHMNPIKSKINIDVLEVDRDFYMQFNPWKQPESEKRIKQINFKSFDMNIKDFKKRLQGKKFDEEEETHSFLEKFKSIFN